MANQVRERSIRPVIRDFADPGFSRGQEKDSNRWKKVILVIVITLGFMAGASALFAFSPWFHVREVHLTGLEFVNEHEVRANIESVLAQKRHGILSLRHRMFIDNELVKKELEQTFAFSEVTVGQRSGVLSVAVRERPTGVYVSDGKRAVFTDLTGIVVRDATAAEQEMVGKSDTSLPFLLLFVESAIDPKTSDRVFPDDFLNHYQSLKLRFEVETGLAVHQYVLPRANATWMKVKLADKREIYIDMQRDVEPQIDKLLTLMRTKGKELDTISYIDLRFSDHVYIK